MSLEFKPITAKDIDRLTPFYMMRRNRTCDSVFLESFLWREYYNVRYAIWEERALAGQSILELWQGTRRNACRQPDWGKTP